MKQILEFLTKLSHSIIHASIEDLVRSLATLGCLTVTLYLWLAGKDVPHELMALTTFLVGYFLGRVQTLMTGRAAPMLTVYQNGGD